MTNQNMKVKMAVIIACIFIAITAQSANALLVTGTAILRDADPSVAPISYYLALPKGTCNIIVSGTFGSGVSRTLLKVNVATANISGTPQNLQTCYDPNPPTSTYITYFSCPATVTITDTSPFLYITFYTDKTPGYGPPIQDIAYRYQIAHLDVAYSCQ
jgi:hypothetical protein